MFFLFFIVRVVNIVKKIELINPDYLGSVKKIRHACRGVIMKADMILLSYEKKDDVYMIPGGGVEDNESFIECCKREVLEETGVICNPVNNYLVIDEFFSDMQHINHYFTCEVIEETSDRQLTQREIESGLIFVWVPIDVAITIFGQYEKYLSISNERFGLYRREFLALKSLTNEE